MVTAFLDHALDPEAEQRFVAHIPTCPGCDRYLDQVRQTIRVLYDLPIEHLRTSGDGSDCAPIPPGGRCPIGATLAGYKALRSQWAPQP